MIQRNWEDVVAALLRLGCVVVRESTYRVTLCRGAAVIQHVAKINPVPVSAQRHLIAAFSFAESEYDAAFR